MKFDLANEERVGMGLLWMGAAGSMAVGQEAWVALGLLLEQPAEHELKPMCLFPHPV